MKGMRVCRCLQVTDMRNKARLLVPEGAMLVGVMDEFNVLQEGQVFVQVGWQHPISGAGQKLMCAC
jgi:hypothetical protein